MLKNFSEEKVIASLRQHEAGNKTAESFRQLDRQGKPPGLRATSRRTVLIGDGTQVNLDGLAGRISGIDFPSFA